ncbi:acyltransferase family protein [Cryptosporangium aurantiacum]|uniref:Peptidoglycan/LPS O-acetylase OafA/YrhL, contains acyltransferase and SGNH-hydrolase domains n=1 Tax=Cryptosporangium aurantiacum TaxID=134849 RepID=A0A1M7Q730_9ACTN|nr:acyltransferase [Cryptosporangium aurantiacum]SHN26278.1 Peptidoglycan/LPS O-acetylase OafA/YrhL, contains acyltransferase and SGNH-hydrolase domains [Cryptosporangium aurantiacum]
MTATALEKTAETAVDLPDAVRAHVSPPPEKGRSERNRYFDVLRAASIACVVLYHTFPLAVLSYWPRMGLLFAIAGSLTARSLDTNVRRAVGTRLRRLLLPLWVAALIAVPLMLGLGWRPDAGWELLFWVVPFADPPGAPWAGPLTEVLWYLRTYFWLLLLSPLLLPLFRRFPRTTVLVPVTVAVAIGTGLFDVWTLGAHLGAVVRDASVYLPCWLLGFAHRDGWIAHARRRLVLVGGVALVLAGVVWALAHPESGSVDLNAIPLAQLLYSAGIGLLLLRATPRWAGLERRWWPYQPVNWLVLVVNRRAVVIYLWHNVALALSFPIGTALGVWTLGTVGGMAACCVITLVLICAGVVAVGWVEDVSAGRRPMLLPRLPERRETAAPSAEGPGPGPADARPGPGPADARPSPGPADARPGPGPGGAAAEQADVEGTGEQTAWDPWALRLLRADQIPAEQSHPIQVVHAVGIAGAEVRVGPAPVLVREVAWSAYPGKDEPERGRRSDQREF